MSSVGQNASKRKGVSKKRSHKIQKISTEADESAWQFGKGLKTIKVRHQTRNPYEHCPNITSYVFKKGTPTSTVPTLPLTSSKKRSHKIQKISTEADESAWQFGKGLKTIKVRHQTRNPYEHCPNITSYVFTNAASHAPTMSKSDWSILSLSYIHTWYHQCVLWLQAALHSPC